MADIWPKYDPEKYESDFPDSGYLNWKIIRIKSEGHIWDGGTPMGVLLHDGNFVVNGVLVPKEAFEVIDEDPLGTFYKEVGGQKMYEEYLKLRKI